MSVSIIVLPMILIFAPLIGCWMLVGNAHLYPNVLPMAFPVLQGIFN